MTECIFCKIISGEQSAHVVFEDEKVLGFLDHKPIRTGHTLIIPKLHYETILDIPDEELAYVIQITKKLAGYIKKRLNAVGFRIANNNFRPAGQVVPHFHFHIVPIAPDIPYEVRTNRLQVSETELQTVAERIRFK